MAQNSQLQCHRIVGGESVFSESLREMCNLNVSLYWSTKPAVAYDVQHSEQVHDLNLTEHGDQASNTKYNKISTDSKHDNDLSKDSTEMLEGEIALKLLPTNFEDVYETDHFTEEKLNVILSCSTARIVYSCKLMQICAVWKGLLISSNEVQADRYHNFII